jgi:drug/metabolite transporter (DMT)-like permease
MSGTALRAPHAGPTALGLVFTLASAIFMAWLGVLTQLAFDAGATTGTLLAGRFLVAALLLWPLVWLVLRRRPSRRQVLSGLLLGVGYSAHAWLFSSSLARLDAGLVDLLLFTYPALVLLGAVLLRRERLSARHVLALGAATAGAATVLVGGLDSIDPLGAALALGAAVAYAAYILLSSEQLERTDPLLLIALASTGAAATLTVAGLARSDVSLDAGASAFGLIAVVGGVAVAGMCTFVAGIERLGPSRASIVSAVQPALTPVIGYAVFADRLGPAQVLGGALVISGVVLLEARRRRFEDVSGYAWLPRGERRTLARVASTIDVPSGGSLLRQGALAHGFFVIVSGRARVVRDDRHVGELGPGEFFGELALLGGGTRTASVVAATDITVGVIRGDEFGAAMRNLPTLARRVRAVALARLATLPVIQPLAA